MQGLCVANETAYARAAARLDELEQMDLGPAVHSGLLELRNLPMDSAAAVRTTALWLLVAHCEAQSMIAITEAVWAADVLVHDSGHEAERVIAQDLAAMTNVTFGSAMNRVALVEQVSRALPASWEALDRGRLTLTHVKALAHVTAGATARVAAAVDARTIPAAIANGWTPAEVARAANRALIAIDPDGAVERAAAAKESADITFYAEQHESATVVATGDAVPLRLIMDAIDSCATGMGRDGDPRPIGQRRLAALAAFVLGGEQVSRPAVETVVTIDLASLLGMTNRPGELSGYGPITADTTRELSKDASLRRLITDPATGRMVDLGRDRYRVSEPLRRLIEARDRSCRFPGCSRRASDSDVDHVVEWDRGGPTDAANLHALCRMHHNLKTRKLWHVDINPDGSETWTTPLGFTYVKAASTHPLDLIEPPDDSDIPEQTDRIPEHDPDPPLPDQSLPTPPSLTAEEYQDFLDVIDRGFGSFADRAYDALRSAGLLV